MRGYDLASLVGLGLYALVWIFAGDRWVSRSLQAFIREYERIHRKRVLYRSDLSSYRNGWKLLTGTVEPGRVWSDPQPEPELEALRQEWLSRRRASFVGLLTTIPIELVNVTILPYALALFLAGYFMWLDMRDARTARRAWLRLPSGRSGGRPIDDDALDSSNEATFAEDDLPKGSGRRMSRRLEILLAGLAIPLVAALFYEFLWLSTRF